MTSANASQSPTEAVRSRPNTAFKTHEAMAERAACELAMSTKTATAIRLDQLAGKLHQIPERRKRDRLYFLVRQIPVLDCLIWVRDEGKKIKMPISLFISAAFCVYGW